jgi:hypothetical protein
VAQEVLDKRYQDISNGVGLVVKLMQFKWSPGKIKKKRITKEELRRLNRRDIVSEW